MSWQHLFTEPVALLTCTEAKRWYFPFCRNVHSHSSSIQKYSSANKTVALVLSLFYEDHSMIKDNNGIFKSSLWTSI